MKSLRLIFKNSIKNTFSNKPQFIGLTLLITLLSLILCLMSTVSTRLLSNYNEFKEVSNLHDAVLKMDPFDSVPTGDVSGYEEAPKNTIEAQQYWLYKLQRSYTVKSASFDWTRTEAREFSQVLGANKNSNLTLKVVSKISSKDSKDSVDKLIINEGKNFEQGKRQVVIDKTFAQKNNIAINDIIRFQKDTLGNNVLVGTGDESETLKEDLKTLKQEGLDTENSLYTQKYSNYNWFQVVGFGNSADFSAPILNSSTILPDKQKEGIVYIDASFMGLSKDTESEAKYGFELYNWKSEDDLLVITSNSERESFFSLKGTKTTLTSFDVEEMNQKFKKEIGDKTDNKLFYLLGDSDYRFNSRTSLIESTIKVYNLISTFILILILIVCLYTMALITKKQIDKARAQIGTMKSLGQRKRQIVFTFVTTPMFASIFGGIFGYLISQIIFASLSKIFSLYFSLNIPGWSFDAYGFSVAFFGIWFFMIGIAFLIAFLIMRKDALLLLNANKAPNMSKLAMFVKKINLRNSFGSKMRTALLSNSLGKMSGVGLVVVIATICISISYLAPDILKRNQKASYNGVNYKQEVEYDSPVYNNPYSFEKTFKVTDDTYDYSLAKTGSKYLLTNMPTSNGKFDMEKIISDYYNNEITNRYYTLNPVANSDGSMSISGIPTTNMKMLNSNYTDVSSDYLRKMNENPVAIFTPDIVTRIVMPTLFGQWPDYSELKTNLSEASDQLVIAKLLQKFYTKYKNTISLSLSKIDDTTWANTPEGVKLSFNKANSEFGLSNDENSLDSAALEKLTNDDFYVYATKDISTSTKGTDYSYFKLSDFSDDDLKTFNATISTWIGMLFIGRMDEAIIQSAYTRSPYFVSEYMKSAFENEKQYNIAFGLVSFDKDSEQLGTLINASKDDLSFKIYGIENNNRFIDLRDEGGNNLVQKMYDSTEENSIVINESLAKKLNLSEGQTVDLDVIQDELVKNNSGPSKVSAYSLSDWDNGYVYDSNNGFTPSTEMENGKITLNGNSLTSNILGIKDGGASEVYKKYTSKDIDIVSKQTSHKFTIVGIHNGYGSPAAWIKQNEANKVLQYDKVENYLWKDQFIKQWNTQFSLDNTPSEYKISGLDLRKVTSLDDFVEKYVNSEDTSISSAAAKIYQIFKNQFPIFNYKYTLTDSDIGDLQRTVSTFNELGDYSPIALNGGKPVISLFGSKEYTGIGQGSIKTVLPIAISQQILAQLSTVILYFLIFMIILVIAITFVIILLTTSLIIVDNSRFIATMKILGYKNAYIAKNILGMYLIVIVSTFAIGYTIAWYIFSKIVSTLWTKTSLVLPLSFPIWSIFAVFISIVGIYLVTIAIGFKAIVKLDATKALQDSDF